MRVVTSFCAICQLSPQNNVRGPATIMGTWANKQIEGSGFVERKIGGGGDRRSKRGGGGAL